MDTYLLRLHQSQIKKQCVVAAIAFNQLQGALNRRGDRNSIDEIWAAIQSLLSAAANISKTCWGQSPQQAAFRKPIRDSLGIPDDSPLYDRKLRNHFDHFDVRLDEWYAKSSTHNIADSNIGPREGFVVGVEMTFFRHFDPASGSVSFFSDDYSIPALHQEIERIYPIVLAESAKPPWEDRTSTEGFGQ